MDLSQAPNGLNGGPKDIEPTRRTKICITLQHRYIPGSGPPLPPLRLLPENDSTAFIKDRLLLPSTGSAASGKALPRRMMYLVGFIDLPAATLLVPAMKVLEYVSPYALEQWESKFEEELDDERMKLEVEKQATEAAAAAVAAEAATTEEAVTTATALIMRKKLDRPPVHSNIEAAVIAEPETVAKAKSQPKKGVMMSLVSPAKKRLQDFEGLGSEDEDELHRDYQDRYDDLYNMGASKDIDRAPRASEGATGKVRDSKTASAIKMANLDLHTQRQPMAASALHAASTSATGFRTILRPPSPSGPSERHIQDRSPAQALENPSSPFQSQHQKFSSVQRPNQPETPIPPQQRDAADQLQSQDRQFRQLHQSLVMTAQLPNTQSVLQPPPLFQSQQQSLQQPSPYQQDSASRLPDLRYPLGPTSCTIRRAEEQKPPRSFTPIKATAARPASEETKIQSTRAKRPASEETKAETAGAKRPASEGSSNSASQAKRRLRDPEYYVEGLEDVRFREDPDLGIVRQFKVRWEGDWPPELKLTWEPERNIPVKMVKLFMTTYESQRRNTSAATSKKKQIKQQVKQYQRTLSWSSENRYSSVTEAFAGVGDSVLGPNRESQTASDRDQDEIFVVTSE